VSARSSRRRASNGTMARESARRGEGAATSGGGRWRTTTTPEPASTGDWMSMESAGECTSTGSATIGSARSARLSGAAEGGVGEAAPGCRDDGRTGGGAGALGALGVSAKPGMEPGGRNHCSHHGRAVGTTGPRRRRWREQKEAGRKTDGRPRRGGARGSRIRRLPRRMSRRTQSPSRGPGASRGGCDRGSARHAHWGGGRRKRLVGGPRRRWES
jgi:hypothetical protein